MEWIDRIGKRLRPRDLHVFLAVAESGSMAKAAERLACSRPVVSKSIAELEEILRVRLFDRTSTGIELTRYGLALQRRSAAVFDELRQTVSEIDQLLDPNAGDLRIGCLEPMMAGLAAQAINRVLLKSPRLRIHTLTGNSTAQLQWLVERKCEVVLVRQVNSDSDPNIDEEVLFHERLVVIARADHPYAGLANLSLIDLIDENWILSSFETERGGPAFEAFEAVGRLPDIRIISDSLALRYSLVATGRFLTMIPASVLALGPNQPGIVALPVEVPGWRRPRVLATLRGRTLSPAAASFAAEVRTLANDFNCSH